MIKIVLVEDSDDYARTVSQYVARYEADSGEEIELRRYTDGLAFLDEFTGDCDVVLMDIEMPHMDGLAAAKKMRETAPSVPLIFMTVMAQLAIKGYEVDAMDFMVKPISYFDFSLKLKKAIDLRRRENAIVLRVLNDEGGKEFVTSSDIYFIESMAHKCIFHTVRGDLYRYGSMSELESVLGPSRFLRAGKSFLVNPAYIMKINTDSVVVNGTEVPVSRSKRKQFMENLAAYLKFVY